MDNKEFETKVLGIDVEEIIQKLRAFGADESPEVLSKRYVFDMESDNIEWIRLRQTGNKTTLTYKYKVLGNTDIGKTVEIEVEVSDFTKTALILQKLSFKQTYYQENKNHIFRLGDIEFSIDTWPMLDPYLEIESTNEKRVKEGLKLLELTGDMGDKDIKEIYQDRGIDLHSFAELKF